MGDQLDLISIAVGHGDATLLHWQPVGGRHFAMLIDGGPKNSGSLIKKLLANRKITRLDIVVLTHVDADHVDGLLEIASDIEIGLYLGPCVRAFERHSWLFAERVLKALSKARKLEELLKSRGVETRYPIDGYSPLMHNSEIKVRVLSPAGRYLERLLLDDSALELFSTFPVPQGWLLAAPRPHPDEPSSSRILREKLISETSITSDDVDSVEDTKATVPDVDSFRKEVMLSAELEPDFFGNPVLNDTSLVVQVDVLLDNLIRRRVLLTGDLENWAYLLTRHSTGLDVDILKASHHGGYVYVEKAPADFDSVYQWLRPSAVLVSASGQHHLPKRGFREAVAGWGASLFCPNTRGLEVVYGSAAEDKSCFGAFSCTNLLQRSTTLTVTKDAITADTPACLSGIGRRVLPVVRVQQHVIQPSAILDRMESTEIENHVRWIDQKLKEIHSERKKALRRTDLATVDVDTLRTHARAAGRHVLAASIEGALMYGARHGRVWVSEKSRDQTVYCMPTTSDLASVRKWLNGRSLLLLKLSKTPERHCLEDVLDGANSQRIAEKIAHEFYYPVVTFRDAFWPMLAGELRKNFTGWWRNDDLLLVPHGRASLGLSKVVEQAFSSEMIGKYRQAKEEHGAFHHEKALSRVRLEELSATVLDADPGDSRYSGSFATFIRRHVERDDYVAVLQWPEAWKNLW